MAVRSPGFKYVAEAIHRARGHTQKRYINVCSIQLGTSAHLYRIGERRHRVIYCDGTWEDHDDERYFIMRPRGEIGDGDGEDDGALLLEVYT